MHGIQEWKIEAKNVKSLCWQGDTLVDWVSGGNVYQLDGTIIPRYVGYAYRFDAAVVSPSGDYAVIYEKLGTKGLVLHKGDILREINRSFYHANAYEYPIALFKLPDGREVIAYCPDDYNRLEIDELATGKRLTESAARKPMDYFYSRLSANPNGTLLLSAGWYWHPWSSITLHATEKALEDPLLLDKAGLIPHIDPEVSSAAFLGDHKLLISTSDEKYDDYEDENPNSTIKPTSQSIALYDYSTQNFISSVVTDDIGGTMLPLNDELVIGFYEHPKIISLKSGKTLHNWSELKTGNQMYSIIWHTEPVPPLALDPIHQRFAVADENSITVIQIDPAAFLQDDKVKNP